MSRKQRLQDMRKAKDRRMKKIAIGGGVVLVAVLAFEMSHMLGGHKAAAPAATTTATTAATGAPTSTTPASAPTTAAGTASAADLPTTGSTKLPNSDVPPNRSKSELDSFSDFAGKDPFAQQIASSSQLSTPSTGSGSSSASTGPSAAGTSTPIASTAAKVKVGSAQGSSARTLAKVGSATISVNGRRELVRVGAGFPSSQPLFKLVSITHGVARIGIASGSYTSGAHTVALVAGRTLTLVDTADGVHYKLRLVAG